MQNEVKTRIIEGGGIPISPIIDKNAVIIGYIYSTLECTDCRIRGKSLAPPFWKP
jgi:hypothetical protein